MLGDPPRSRTAYLVLCRHPPYHLAQTSSAQGRVLHPRYRSRPPKHFSAIVWKASTPHTRLLGCLGLLDWFVPRILSWPIIYLVARYPLLRVAHPLRLFSVAPSVVRTPFGSYLKQWCPELPLPFGSVSIGDPNIIVRFCHHHNTDRLLSCLTLLVL